jgi:vancomycin resistance protein VanJ
MILQTASTAVHVQRPTAARTMRRPILTIASWGYLLVVIAIWIFLRQMGDRGWIATLLLIAPRWPLLLPTLLLAPFVIKAKSWWPRGAVTAATTLVLTALMGFRIAMPIVAPDRGDLRLLTFNVHRQHVDPERFLQFIRTVNPDVIALQDWSSADQQLLFAGPGWTVRQQGELLVASRYPIGRITPLDFADVSGNAPKAERGAAACFELLTPTGPINLINVHLASPHSGLSTIIQDHGNVLAENIERRWRESELMRDLADRTPEPFLLCGDFNTTDDSPIFREHWGDFTDAFSDRGSGFGYTYLIDHTQLRIDHILTSQSWKPIRCWVGPELGSPHRPLVGDFMFR